MRGGGGLVDDVRSNANVWGVGRVEEDKKEEEDQYCFHSLFSIAAHPFTPTSLFECVSPTTEKTNKNNKPRRQVGVSQMTMVAVAVVVLVQPFPRSRLPLAAPRH
jgi:hypothetical protein